MQGPARPPRRRRGAGSPLTWKDLGRSSDSENECVSLSASTDAQSGCSLESGLLAAFGRLSACPCSGTAVENKISCGGDPRKGPDQVSRSPQEILSPNTSDAQVFQSWAIKVPRNGLSAAATQQKSSLSQMVMIEASFCCAVVVVLAQLKS